MHEDCTVPHAGPIHCPHVDVVCICTRDNVSECMAVEEVEVVFVVVDSCVQSGVSSKLHFNDGIETVAISVRIDIFSRIEFNPSFVLSSDNTNCKNDIQ